jgi:heparan-alpha-glucosaminide N-acetyltransferase
MKDSTPPRLASVDAYRGFVMILMMAEVLHLGRVAKAFPESEFWKFLAYHQSHVEWVGCSLHDLIQPSFSFLVGTALAFSLAKRLALKYSLKRIVGHATFRAGVLILLGVFLRSVGRKQTNWTFEDTLTQIGLGYVPLVLIALATPVWRWAALAAILVGYGLAFAAYPLPEPGHFTKESVGVTAEWEHHPQGFAGHWDKNSNAAWAFDTWFLNLFPREKPFAFNGGGYATLSFIPTLGTMILGLIAGSWLLRGMTPQSLGVLVFAGIVCLTAGYGLDRYGICPNVKRIWTPSWTLFSGGWCFLILALFALTTDMIGKPGWSYPLRVVGANSIVAYVGSHLVEGFVFGSFKTHLGADVFQRWGKDYEPLVGGLAVLAVYGLVLWWMYAKRIFVRL